MVKVLISDKMSPLAKEIFEKRGIETDEMVGLTKEELEAKIHEYDGLAIRSATKVTPKILAAAKNLKVVGRAGIGVDNVDKITDNIMDDLYNKVAGNEWFMQQCKRVFLETFGHDLDNGEKLGFTMMFHYGLFWITHKCICKIINNGTIDNDTILLLENTIVNK